MYRSKHTAAASQACGNAVSTSLQDHGITAPPRSRQSELSDSMILCRVNGRYGLRVRALRSDGGPASRLTFVIE